MRTARRIALMIFAASVTSVVAAGPAQAGPSCNSPEALVSAICFYN